MSSIGTGGELFQHDLYEKSVTDTKTLKARLPVSAVESLAREVLSRLPQQFGSQPSLGLSFTPDMINELATALISEDNKAAGRLVSAQQDAGHSEKSIYLVYLAEAARLLGKWWEADTVDFAQVTIGTARIYAILRVLAPLMRRNTTTTSGKSSFLCSVPGETHTLGVKMASDLLRADGWTIDLAIGETHEQLIERIAEAQPVIIGLSAAGEHAMPGLAKLVMAVRICTPDASIFVGGHIVDSYADLIQLSGVDAMAVDYDESRAALQRLWESRLIPS